jgi:hypothetical protein
VGWDLRGTALVNLSFGRGCATLHRFLTLSTFRGQRPFWRGRNWLGCICDEAIAFGYPRERVF